MHVNQEQLERFIIDSGLVSREDFAKAQKKAQKKGKGAGAELVKEGLINEDDLRRTQAYVLGIPFVNLENQKIDFNILSMIPEPIARKHNIIAFKKNKGTLEVEIGRAHV